MLKGCIIFDLVVSHQISKGGVGSPKGRGESKERRGGSTPGRGEEEEGGGRGEKGRGRKTSERARRGRETTETGLRLQMFMLTCFVFMWLPQMAAGLLLELSACSHSRGVKYRPDGDAETHTDVLFSITTVMRQVMANYETRLTPKLHMDACKRLLGNVRALIGRNHNFSMCRVNVVKREKSVFKPNQIYSAALNSQREHKLYFPGKRKMYCLCIRPNSSLLNHTLKLFKTDLLYLRAHHCSSRCIQALMGEYILCISVICLLHIRGREHVGALWTY